MEERKSGAKLQTDVKHNKARSQAQELSVAKEYKANGFEEARRVPMSGAIATLPADVSLGELMLVECKMTKSGKMIFDWEWLRQVKTQAEREMKEGVVHAWIGQVTGPYEKVVVVPEEFWYTILNELMGYRREAGQ